MAERFELVEKALIKMLEDKKYSTLRDILITMNPSDIAGIFSILEEKQIPLLFRLLRGCCILFLCISAAEGDAPGILRDPGMEGSVTHGKEFSGFRSAKGCV